MKPAYPLSGIFALLLLGLYLACTPEPEYTRVVPNQAPETYFVGAPLDSSNVNHRYHLYWIGLDPDGEVVEYALAVTDSNIAPEPSSYRRTTRTDTIIEFTANNDVVLSHAVWVFAIDNEGERDQTPDREYFNAVDSNRPVPIILTAEKTIGGDTSPLAFNDTVTSTGTSVRFTWTATDADLGGSISAYRIKLSSENTFTEIPADSTGATYENLPSGNYQFLVEAVDNAGAESLDPAVHSWIVNFEPDTRITRMVVNGQDILDFQAGQGDYPPCQWPDEIVTIPNNSRVTFVFTGNDSDGEIQDFSYRIFRTDITRCSTRRNPFTSWFPETAVSLPVVPPSAPDSNQVVFTSNDYEILIRSRDSEGKADGTPASLKFRVNFPPTLRQSALFPAPGSVVDASVSAPGDSLTVRFAADDQESLPINMRYRVIIDRVFGDLVGPVDADSLLFQVFHFPLQSGPNQIPLLGQHEITYVVDDLGRTDSLTTTFTVVP
jgi:hypothetical protein